MSSWKMKTTLQRLLSWLPYAYFWNGLFQKYVTQSLDLTAGRFEHKLTQCRRHLETFQRFCPDPQAPWTVLDLGTGWHPVVPLGLYLCGAKEVWTFDVVPLTSAKRIRDILERFSRYAELGRLEPLLPGVQPQRLEQLRHVLGNRRCRTANELLEPLGIHLRLQDARQTGVAAQAIDLFVSVDVWGHIPEPVLAAILTEFHRLASPRAVLSHLIDMTDLYWYGDRTITPFNFLQFTDQQWRRYDNAIIPQNRLRISDYRQLLAAAQFQVVQETNGLGSLEDLQRVPLAPRFQNYAQEDLLVLSSWLAARPR